MSDGSRCDYHSWSSTNSSKDCPACLKREEIIEQLQAKLKDAEDALEFYGNENNWFSYNKRNCKKVLNISDLEECKLQTHGTVAGKRARQALARIRG